ncbi:hypothetical protein [Rhodoferax sp. PAMC 29310]|uniref:hypothetical protein n=1 Tax=Rhodoferax sp. PAMC 29310 TaxID=2822760 RepID=UPI001B324C05|nr:hypothetical protein [Rhodoferax sp. PAMC 29310]
MNVSSVKSTSIDSTQSQQRVASVQKEQQRDDQAKEAAASAAEKAPPRPVINTQGQTTGQVLNVTA